MGEHLIKVENLTLSYENMTVVKDLSFTVESGDYLCIVGENGSGKSTLVKSLLSLKKPVGGEITFGGGLRRNEIGYLPQQTAIQRDFPASVWEVVLSGVLNEEHNSPFYSKRDKNEAMKNLKKLDIVNLKKRCYRELSGGQQQRVLLARALCATDSLLILDEPVTGLDPAASLDFYEEIKKLNREGVTIVMVTHDIKNAMKYATHILHLEQGDDFFGTVDEYRKSKVSNMFLGGRNNA